MTRVLIVDDEPPARKKLRRLLSEAPDMQVAAEAGTGADAIAAIQREKPDLVLLDIQLPDMTGFDVLAALEDQESLAVIFVTAFDQHALAAFEARALDYLLKPVAPDRFEAALQRARKLLIKPPTSAARFAKRFLVEQRGSMVFIAVDAVDRLESGRNYVVLHAGADTYTLRATLESMQHKLDPAQFARVNRSAIVNVDRVKELHPWTNGEYRIVMRDGSELMWSRRYINASLEALLC
jgi:two-component system LytT family response regulator